MQRAYLIAENEPGGAKKIPIGSGIVIGRAMDCGLIIDDAAASRRHVEVFPQETKMRWRDLGSTNGTLLNGAKMLEGLLTPGDRLQIGESVIRFDMEEAEEEPKADESTLFKPTIIDASGTIVNREAAPSRSELILQTLYQFIGDISSEFDPVRLVDRVVEKTATTIQAQRCMLLFSEGPDAPLRPCPGCTQYHLYEDGRLRLVDVDEIKISRTVIKRVLSDGETVFFQDATSDSELKAAQSVLSLKLRSIICVPLRGKRGIIGLLYMDSNRPGQSYSEDDLLLATAIGNSTGLALENALLQKEMLQKQRIEQEIEVAWTIQEGFLVKDWPKEGGRYEVFGTMAPAQTVGGDFYDYITLDENRVAILIGDVSGKGVPASLTMAKLLAEFRVCAKEADDPTEVIARLNDSLVRHSKRGMFCTIHYLTVYLDSGRIVSLNAGHHSAMIAGPSGVREFGMASGPPVGVLDYASWEPREAVLAPGDVALIYTDGIVEARRDPSQVKTQAPSSNGDAPADYGEENLAALLVAQQDLSPRAVVEAVTADLKAFCGGCAPHDDCTLIALRYLG